MAFPLALSLIAYFDARILAIQQWIFSPLEQALKTARLIVAKKGLTFLKFQNGFFKKG